ncbi:cryptochrome/photolyase family protein [Pseudonocardia sp. KRD-184]|uniref:Cryptochrome/photolyase family protein n=1 Tax=Pseudonocardia oceani TaxID=2792013 RepID=A0ABS6UCL1_9PSEU|nr:cryptochrome/photolyase family protein [Pseudonocardia oceani]MBW0090878.1 cryptochrome/photolyase family protein [Pseudonocardia oceani]MBW0096728.1 cryptochrome/photolyase family protein [Pseudonocardia oceani]MBW0110679.1 cryptochrome/photolyase family protein [Pseudonocardia oceani]MBW0121744.1 cryptochrome/photolyase family protein [Pseudonocardia oceani]MBW0129904.1 cryptochrome/photolyase family protein [Pseudonocardia oceani]
MPAPLWLFADQLGPHVHDTDAHRDREVVLVESARVLRSRPFHRQKLHIVLSGMRHLADELGDRATYLRTDTYREALEQVGRPVVVHEPTSFAAADLVERLHAEGLVEEVLPTPTFALPRADFDEWAGDRDTFRMEDFYRSQRRRFDVLMEAGEPVGGTWNYDKENREPPPKGVARLDVAGPWQPPEDAIDDGVRRDLEALDLPTVGADGPRWFAVTAAEARRALAHFVQERLPHFGPPEDAMLTEDWAMAHSLLSVPLNLGLLHPLDVAREAESAYRSGDVPLPSAEGFVRQVLGWREYMWQLYWRFGRDYMRDNALRAHTPLPEWWTSLDADAVTAKCLSTALAGVRDRGWAHHIQRLMILGNHALQRGYDPRALSDWFRESFVDGFEWVMPPNVIGMSQHADGGRLATKPYSSGGAYVNRMSDHCRDCAYDPKKRLGDDACPYTAGYWAWTHRHRDLLAANNRTSRAVASMNRLGDLDAVLEQESAREEF